MAGLALLIPAAIGLNDGGPTILSPLPALTLLPALASEFFHLGRSAIAIPTLFFFMWLPGLLFGDGKIPKRSWALLAVAAVLNVYWFVVGWRVGIQDQGALYTCTVFIVNFAAVSFLAIAFFKNWKRNSSFSTSLIIHWILFAWLAWYAFPFLGDMP
jgi:hypothetical protein